MEILVGLVFGLFIVLLILVFAGVILRVATRLVSSVDLPLGRAVLVVVIVSLITAVTGGAIGAGIRQAGMEQSLAPLAAGLVNFLVGAFLYGTLIRYPSGQPVGLGKGILISLVMLFIYILIGVGIVVILMVFGAGLGALGG